MNKKMVISLIILFLVSISVSVYAQDNSIEYKKSIQFMKENIDIKLSKSRNGNFQIYKDSGNNEYIYKNHQLVGYFSEKNISNENSQKRIIQNFKETDYIKIAENYVKEIIDTNVTSFDNYRFEKSDIVNDYQEINYTYTKFINDFKTNDSITVSLNFDGTLASISASRQGIFNNLKILVSEKEVENYVDNYIKENYPTLNYKISDMVVDYVDDKYVISVFTVISNGEEQFSNYIYYDL